MPEPQHGVILSPAPESQGSGYWERFRHRFRWVALGILVLNLVAVVPWPGLHGSTPTGLHLPRDWDIVAMSCLWYLLVVGLPVGLLVAAFPSRSSRAISR